MLFEKVYRYGGIVYNKGMLHIEREALENLYG
jgi:hypothetical protein